MLERRKYKREHLIHYLRVFDRTTNELTGQLVDITPDGIMLITDHPMVDPASHSFFMEFPEEVAGKTHLEFTAKPMWCKVDINPDMFAVGCEINQVSQADVDIIQALINEYRDSE